MKLRLFYTFGLVLLASTLGLSNECSNHEHPPAAVSASDSIPQKRPVSPLSSYPIIRLLYI